MTYGVQRSFEPHVPAPDDAPLMQRVIVDYNGQVFLEGGGRLKAGEYIVVPRERLREATDRGW